VASVSFEHVTKRYRPSSAAVNDLSLEIRDGEFVVLVGPSGCGKTTTLRLLAGLEQADEGVIRIGGRVVNDVPPRDRDIAMVFQTYALYPHMSAFDNMAFGLKMRGVPADEIRNKVAAVAGMLGISECLQRRPRELSGGERQRVALGRASVREPAVLLLDEPLSNLDASLRHETRVNLQRLHRQLGTTFVYVTHDQVEAMTLADRIAVLKEGVLQQCAAPIDLYDRPANMYVARFIGSPRMNLVPVTVDGVTASGSGIRLDLPRAPGIANAVLGFRPEDLTDRPLDPDTAPRVRMQVDLTVELGAERYVYGKVGGADLVARTHPHVPVRPGDAVTLFVNRRGLHLFDAATERTIL